MLGKDRQHCRKAVLALRVDLINLTLDTANCTCVRIAKKVTLTISVCSLANVLLSLIVVTVKGIERLDHWPWHAVSHDWIEWR